MACYYIKSLINMRFKTAIKQKWSEVNFFLIIILYSEFNKLVGGISTLFVKRNRTCQHIIPVYL